jgi:hypothetical protein
MMPDAMQEYVFEARVVASARVRAGSEALAFEIISSAVGPPSLGEIKLANEAGFVEGKKATIVSVDFFVDEDSIKLIEVDGEPVRREQPW